MQGRGGRGSQWWRQGCGVAKGAAGLQQLFPQRFVAGQKRSAAGKGFAEGAADQMHWMAKTVTETSASAPQDSQGMGLIDQ